MFFSESEVKVRYAETDAMAVVHHASYIVWFEIGRTDFIEQLGYTYADMEEKGYLLPVLDIHASYKKPLKYGDNAVVKTFLEEYDGLRIRFFYEIYNQQNERCVEGSSTHVIVKKETFKPTRLKSYMPQLHEAFNNVRKLQA